MRAHGDRYSGALDRLQRGYGPRMGRTQLELPPPAGNNLLFDWNPAVDPYADLVGGLTGTLAGDAVVSVERTLPCVTFAGSGAILFDAPFASIDDVAGDRFTVYVVAEFTGAGTTVTRSLWGMGDDSAGANQIEAVSIYMLEATNVTVVNSADEAAAQFDVGPALTRDSIQVFHADVSMSGELILQIDGAVGGGTALTGTPHTPENMDKMAIGTGYTFTNSGTSPETLGTGWVGHIYRVLIYSGAFSSDVVDGL